ncbi:MAG: O-antigen ligase family protein [Candidatus Babeliaceae bacterium]|nr:O-antigen ligase family protein [Candidatus Babeliaceae bacterium]
MRLLFLMAIYWGALPIILMTDPFYGVLEYAFINIIRPEQLLWSGAVSVGRIFYAVQAVSFFSWLINRQKFTPENTPVPHQIKVMLIICAGMLISLPFAIGPFETNWKWTFQFIKISLFCFVLSQAINTAKKLEWYYAASLGWFMFLEIWGIYQKLGGNAYMEGIGGDQLGDRNDLSSVIILYLPMAYYFLYNRKRWIRLCIGIPATIISVTFIFFAQSRGGFLGLAICLIFIFMRTSGFQQKIKMIVTLLTVVILLIAFMIPLAPEGFFDEYTARLKTMLGEQSAEDTGEIQYESSAAGRLAMWKAAYYFMRQHPEFWLVGMGQRGFSAIYFRYIHEIALYLNDEDLGHVIYGGQGGKAIHNAYLNIFTSGGFIVFLPWIYLLFFGWYQAHNIPKKYPRIIDGVDIHNYARAVEIGLVGAYATIVFTNTEYVDFYYWHLVMAGIIANLGKAKLKRNELAGEDEEFMETFS